MATTDLADLGLDEGGHLLVARALARLAHGERLTVTGRHPALLLHLAARWREHGPPGRAPRRFRRPCSLLSPPCGRGEGAPARPPRRRRRARGRRRRRARGTSR